MEKMYYKLRIDKTTDPEIRKAVVFAFQLQTVKTGRKYETFWATSDDLKAAHDTFALYGTNVKITYWKGGQLKF